MADTAPEAPREQGEKQEAHAQIPEEARREEQKAEVREKYQDDQLEVNDTSAIATAKEYINKDRETPLELSGEVYKKGDSRFDEAIDFIKGHASDHPGNANLDDGDVARIVAIILTEGEMKGQGVVVALNERSEVIAVAD